MSPVRPVLSSTSNDMSFSVSIINTLRVPQDYCISVIACKGVIPEIEQSSRQEASLGTDETFAKSKVSKLWINDERLRVSEDASDAVCREKVTDLSVKSKYHHVVERFFQTHQSSDEPVQEEVQTRFVCYHQTDLRAASVCCSINIPL